MLRSIILKQPQELQFQFMDDVVFPEIHNKSNRETILSIKPTNQQRFIKIVEETSSLHCQFGFLEPYQEDQIKFIAKINFHQTENGVSEIKIIPVPISCCFEYVTFLLVVELYKNQKFHKKSHFAKQKQICIEMWDLIDLSFMISEEIFIDQKDLSLVVEHIEKQNRIYSKQVSKLYILSTQKMYKSESPTGVSTSIGGLSKYFPVKSRFSKQNDFLGLENVLKAQFASSGIITKQSRKNSMINSRKDSINENQSVLSFESHLIKNEIKEDKAKKKKLVNQLNKIFTEFSYLKDETTGIESIIEYHSSEQTSQNFQGLLFKTFKTLICQWHQFKKNPKKLFDFNMKQILKDTMKNCIENFGNLAQMDLQCLSQRNVDEIFKIIKQFEIKVKESYLHQTKQFINEEPHEEVMKLLIQKINIKKQKLLQTFALSKFQHGSRKLIKVENSQKEDQGYLLSKIIGSQQFTKIQLGFNLYRQIIQNRLGQAFKQLGQDHKKLLRKKVVFTTLVTNDAELLLNIEARIDISKRKKQLIDMAIDLQEKQAETLKQVIGGIEKEALDEWEVITHTEDKQIQLQ